MATKFAKASAVRISRAVRTVEEMPVFRRKNRARTHSHIENIWRTKDFFAYMTDEDTLHVNNGTIIHQGLGRIVSVAGVDKTITTTPTWVYVEFGDTAPYGASIQFSGSQPVPATPVRKWWLCKVAANQPNIWTITNRYWDGFIPLLNPMS